MPICEPRWAPPSAGAASPVRLLAIVLIRGYQLLISPLLPPACRFYPSCSSYALGAIAGHGILRGGWLALARIARCHPWHPGGVDPVPGTGKG
jgi:uncharacterized protein